MVPHATLPRADPSMPLFDYSAATAAQLRTWEHGGHPPPARGAKAPLRFSTDGLVLYPPGEGCSATRCHPARPVDADGHDALDGRTAPCTAAAEGAVTAEASRPAVDGRPHRSLDTSPDDLVAAGARTGRRRLQRAGELAPTDACAPCIEHSTHSTQHGPAEVVRGGHATAPMPSAASIGAGTHSMHSTHSARSMCDLTGLSGDEHLGVRVKMEPEESVGADAGAWCVTGEEAMLCTLGKRQRTCESVCGAFSGPAAVALPPLQRQRSSVNESGVAEVHGWEAEPAGGIALPHGSVDMAREAGDDAGVVRRVDREWAREINHDGCRWRGCTHDAGAPLPAAAHAFHSGGESSWHGGCTASAELRSRSQRGGSAGCTLRGAQGPGAADAPGCAGDLRDPVARRSPSMPPPPPPPLFESVGSRPGNGGSGRADRDPGRGCDAGALSDGAAKTKGGGGCRRELHSLRDDGPAVVQGRGRRAATGHRPHAADLSSVPGRFRWRPYRCACRRGVLAAEVRLPQRCACRTGALAAQVRLPHRCACRTGALAAQVRLPHRCACRTGALAAEVRLPQR